MNLIRFHLCYHEWFVHCAVPLIDEYMLLTLMPVLFFAVILRNICSFEEEISSYVVVTIFNVIVFT